MGKKKGRKADARSNMFCRSTDLVNEASVESFFVLRLLKELGYEDKEIRTKRSIQELKIPVGRKKEPYKPDFLLMCRRRPRWLIDAKSPYERIEDYTQQCASYSLLINRKYKERPLRFYMLTNGLLTRVYVWDQEDPILSLRFGDFAARKPKYQALLQLLGADAARTGWPETTVDSREGHVLHRPTMDAVKKAFLRCHRIIWKSEKMSPQAAFLEFAKLMFVKLWEDRRLRDDPRYMASISKGDALPGDAVRFSTTWIQRQEGDVPSPIDTILFHQLVEALEEEIAQRKRKRIFNAQERLNLSPGTIKRVVEQLQDFYLFGIDEDLNGRMFEAFLAATMRGQALGQYFTPRSIVKVMTRLGKPIAIRGKVERVLDACCGTGGFLIEALTEMRRQIYDNTSLTKAERTRLLDEVANQAIFGVDAGRDPPIARVARINMYLHGDGGTRVYVTDGLRPSPQPSGADTVEIREEVAELRGLMEGELKFDLVLTNPPFSMDYSANVPEENDVLQEYELATYGGKRRRSLRSSVMFLERYYDLLKPGGRILTVIDDSVLGGKNYAFVRDYIREKFVIRGIVSLHGDAFQRAGARAKTSVLYMSKPTGESESQPDVFVYESRYIGLDDVVPRTRASVAEKARAEAIQELDDIVCVFAEYLDGLRGPWLVNANRLSDRLDAKFLRPWTVSALEPKWSEAGATSAVLEDLVVPIEEELTLEPDKPYDFLRVTYAGYAERGEQALGKEVTYSRVFTAKPNDIVVSNISAVYRAICVMPQGMEEVLISSEFTTLRLKDGVRVDPHYLWSVLRTAGVIAEWLSGASGVGRHRVDWELLRKQRVPLLPYPRQQKIGDLHREAQHLKEQMVALKKSAQEAISGLDLEGEAAQDRLARGKPPK